MNPNNSGFAADKRLNLILLGSGLAFYWVFCLVLYALSEMPVDPADGIMHYQLARFSWEVPQNLLHHWGKPVFTILSSPFAQLGFVGMVIFNLLLFSLASWCVYALARHFRLAFSGLSPFLLMSSMVFFNMVNAGMTEILMATLTIAGLVLLVKKKPGWAAVLISLTIMVRPESIIVIPAFAVLLAARRRWRSIPLLATGFVFFSLLGYLFGKEPAWVITDDPYPAVSPYGTGGLAHFIKQSDLIFGYFLLIMTVVAIIALLFQLKKMQKYLVLEYVTFSLLVVLLVLGLHSFLWWKGLKGSLGLIRVMATVIPLAAFCALYALNFILTKVRLKRASAALFIALLLFSDLHAFVKSELPTKLDPRLALLAEAAEWYRQQNHQGRVSYLAPYFAFKADINPEDPEKVVLLWSLDKKDPSQSLQKGDLIVWDTQFGQQEASLSEESITENPHLRILQHYEVMVYKGPVLKPYLIYIAEVKR